MRSASRSSASAAPPATAIPAHSRPISRRRSRDGKVTGVAVLSGNRNFEGRVHALVRAAYLASPALVIAHAIAGSVRIDLTREPLGHDARRQAGDARRHLASTTRRSRSLAAHRHRGVLRQGLRRRPSRPRRLAGGGGPATATAIPGSPAARSSPARRSARRSPRGSIPDVIEGLKPLAMLGDAITTDHLSPNGEIRPGTPAARWLADRQVEPEDFGTYAARRGHHAVAVRGTFANAHIRQRDDRRARPAHAG